MTPIDFCIVVYWMHGLTISQIYERWGFRVNKSKAAIRGVTSKLQRSRSEMSLKDRQSMLDHLLMARLDDGMLPLEMFTAKATLTDKPVVARTPPKDKAIPVDLTEGLDLDTKAGKQEFRRRRLQHREKQKKEEDQRENVMRNGGAIRALDPPRRVVLMDKKKLMLADPLGRVYGGAKRDEIFSLRLVAIERIRELFESQYGSGMKTQSFDGGSGGSGASVAIHAAIAERASDMNALRSMMGADVFSTMERMTLREDFVWKVPSKVSSEMILEDIRMALDCVIVLDRKLSPEDFKLRWGFIPRYERKDPEEIFRSNRMAKDMLKRAQRATR